MENMNRITKVISNAVNNNKKLFLPFITAGYPDKEWTIKLLHALEKGGADIIELGVPFSDPTADGPIIQMSSQTALEKGTNLKWILTQIKRFRNNSDIPIIIFTYLNPVLKFGFDEFFKTASEAGADGILVPDLPPEEADDLKSRAITENIHTTFLVTPTTSIDRLKIIEKMSDDFLYCVSVKGTTGARKNLFARIKSYLEYLKRYVTKPFVVGFGISSPEDVRKIGELSNGVVIGSALLLFIEKHKNYPDLDSRTVSWIEQFRKTLNQI